MYISRLSLLVGAAAVTVKAQSAETERLPNLNYVGQGYDLLVGNPHPTGNSADGLLDPGWKANVFRLDFPALDELNTENSFLNEGITYVVPAGVDARACPACSFEFESSELMNSNQYRDSLRVNINANFRGWGASFKGSFDFKRVQERYETENSMVVESSGSCTFYCASVNSFTPPPLTANFRQAVERLPLQYDAEVYAEFINEFGTHIARSVTMGGLFGERSEISATSVRELEEIGVDVQVAASYSALAFSGGVDVMTNFQREQASNFSSARTSRTEFSYGGRPQFGDTIDDTKAWLDSVIQSPLPLSYELDQISSLLTDINFPEDENIDIRQANLVIGLSQHCARLEQEGEIECADRDFNPERAGLVGAPINPSATEPDSPALEINWDDGEEWIRMGQPPMTGLRMWFGAEGLETIQAVHSQDAYQYHATPTNWQDAQTTCLQDGARLLSVHNAAEHEKFAAYLDRLTGAGQTPIEAAGDTTRVQSHWIGLNDLEQEGMFVWEDGSQVSFDAQWGEGEPNAAGQNEDCAEYRFPPFNGDTSLRWNDQQCSNQNPFVCQWPREHGAFPDTTFTPLEFNLQPGEFISSVEVCEPDHLRSLQFTTMGPDGGQTSQVFSLGLARDDAHSLCTNFGGGWYVIPDGQVLINAAPATSWQECQQVCLSHPECQVWNFRVHRNECQISRRTDGTRSGSNNPHISCAARECRDCRETPGTFRRAVDACPAQGTRVSSVCVDTALYEGVEPYRANVQCCALDGSSCIRQLPDGVGCTGNVTYQEAVEVCKAANLRLCTETEVTNNRCCRGGSSGCGYDTTRVWTSLDCTDIVPPVDREQCRTITLSDRLGLLHLSGALGPSESDPERMILRSLGFHGFQEVLLDQAPLPLLAVRQSGVTSHSATSGLHIVALVAIARLVVA